MAGLEEVGLAEVSFENSQNRLAVKISIHQIGFPNDFSIRKEGGPPAFKSTPLVQ